MASGFGPVDKIVVQLTRSERSNSRHNTDVRQGAPRAESREPRADRNAHRSGSGFRVVIAIGRHTSR